MASEDRSARVRRVAEDSLIGQMEVKATLSDLQATQAGWIRTTGNAGIDETALREKQRHAWAVLCQGSHSCHQSNE